MRRLNQNRVQSADPGPWPPFHASRIDPMDSLEDELESLLPSQDVLFEPLGLFFIEE